MAHLHINNIYKVSWSVINKKEDRYILIIRSVVSNFSCKEGIYTKWNVK